VFRAPHLLLPLCRDLGLGTHAAQVIGGA